MYVIHGTRRDHAIKILKDGMIKINEGKDDQGTIINYNIGQIFTQLIYKNIFNENIQKPLWFAVCFIFKKDILKKYPFYSVGIGGFYDSFEEGMNKKSEKVVFGKGNLKIMPKLKKLKDFINFNMKIKNSSTIDFIHSHEILFGNNLPLEDCIGIVFIKIVKDNGENFNKEDEEYIKKLNKLSKKYNLFVKIGEINKKDYHFKGYGLNNFIELIES